MDQSENNNVANSSKLKIEVAREYGVHIATLRSWVKRANLFPDKNKKDKYFTPLELVAIYKQFGNTFNN